MKMKYNTHLLLLLLHFLGGAAAATNITGIFAFGDSIFDSGNNNGLTTICRADHPPYGTALPPASAFGRFSDGKLPADILINELGYKPMLPPFLNMNWKRHEVLYTGVSFASSCSGFDDLTATEVGVLSMSDQYEHFSTAHDYMKADLGRQGANRMLESALFLISGGSNDMLDNYYALPIRKLMYSVSAYHDYLLKNLATFVKKLYMKHARRVGVLGLPPVGCLPVDIASSSWFKRDECVSSHNSDAQQYNDKLKQLLKKLANDLPDLKITYVDIYNPLMDMINNPAKYGFEHTLEGCCGSGSWELGPLCSEYAEVCSDASKYIFWDAAHPTQAAYEKLTKILKDNSLSTLFN